MVAIAQSAPDLSPPDAPAQMGGDPLVVFVRGTLPERAAQFAEAMGPFLKTDARALRFWLNFPQYVMRGQLPHMSDRVHSHLARMMQRMLVHPITKNLPDRFAAAKDAFVDALPLIDLGAATHGQSQKDALKHILTLYDGMNVLVGMPLGARAPAGPLGCSSLVALGDLTASGELIHGRNLDLLPHAYDHRPVLCVHTPERGLKHVSLHHAGGFAPGITSTNEAGVSVGVHQNFTSAVSPQGEALMAMCTEMIERASTLSQALDFLRQRRFAGGWSIVVSDAKRNRAVVVEADIEGTASLFPPRDFLAVANCYRTKKKNHDFAFTGAWREHNWSRLSVLNQKARGLRGKFGIENMAEALGDHTDGYDENRRRAYGNTVSAIHNLDTIIFSPGLDRVYVGIGHSPRNSADGYVGYKLSDLFAGRDEIEDRLDSHVDKTYQRALQCHSDACAALFEDDNKAHAHFLFTEAARLDPDEPLHRFLASTLALQGGDHDAAAQSFAAVVDEESSPYRAGLASLMHGRALDCAGDRSGAKRAYRRVGELSGTVDPLLVGRATAGLRRAFTPKKARALVWDTAMGDIAN